MICSNFCSKMVDDGRLFLLVFCSKLLRQDMGPLSVGDRVEYLSMSAGRWIPCEVTKVDAE